MISTVAISDDTETRLTVKLNEWFKKMPDESILNIQFIHRPGYVRGAYLAFVTYKK